MFTSIFPTALKPSGGAELRKLDITGSLAERRTRADLLLQGQALQRRRHEYRDLMDEASRCGSHLITAGTCRARWKKAASSDKDARQILDHHGNPDWRRRSPAPLSAE